MPIPTLREVLRELPAGMPVVLDMKALPAERQAHAVAKVLTDGNMWSRVMIYSTDTSYQRTPKTIACFRRQAPVKILAIAVNNELDYQSAACLGIDAVLADSPRKMIAIKARLRGKPLQCGALAKK